MKKKNKKSLKTWSDVKSDFFKEDQDFAIEYLQAAIRENADLPGSIIEALRSVSESLNLSLEEVARKAGISKASIYKALGKNGNPTLATLTSILNVMGLRLSIEKKTG